MKFRTKFLIYPKFQIALIVTNLVVLAGMMMAVGLAIHRSYDYLQSEGMAVGLAADHPYFRFVTLQSKVVYQSLGVAFACGLIFSIVLTLLLSQRLVGPIIRLREYFRSVTPGTEIKPLSFRKGDYFPDLPDVINRALGCKDKNAE